MRICHELKTEPMNWDPLKKCFNVELFLAPGRYEYKLLLNKEKPTIDLDNPESVYDGFDGCNSVLRRFPSRDSMGLCFFGMLNA
jgi:hypothetical protein